MKIYKFLLVIILLLLLSNKSVAQSTQFNMDEYKQFLQSHQNMPTSELLEMYNAGYFVDDLNLSLNDVRYLDSITEKCSLTDYEVSLLKKNGFFVSERINKTSFGQAFLEIFHRDLPVFVSTDAILHSFHISYDRILKDTELGFLIPKVKQLLQTLYSQQSLLSLKYGNIPGMMKMLMDVDVYLTVPLKLFELNISPYYPDNQQVIDEILTLIRNEQPNSYKLFADACRIIDWSQFKPRGHYYEDPNDYFHTDLPNYFRVMMWLGRTELYLIKPDADTTFCVPSFSDVKRQIIDSYLIKELIDAANSYSNYEQIENTIKIFAGDQDNVTLDSLTYLQNAISLNNTDELLDSLKIVEFQDSLKKQSFAFQLILSQILYSDPFSPDSIIPASAFMFFGQRFVIDSYITASVVYDRIIGKVCRLLPSLLDVLFSIGNSASAQLLVNELNMYHYSTNLAALRYLIDSYEDDFWAANFYSNWLSIIRKLNPPQDRSNLPEFMKTAAFWQEKMNTQLVSWAELRHDNLLYAKQSYTGGTICSYPYSFVEPFPEFYESLKDFALSAKTRIETINFSDDYIKSSISSYFTTLFEVCDTLRNICIKELNNEMLLPDEILFLKNMIYAKGSIGSGESPFMGWYPRLFYKDTETGTITAPMNAGLLDSDHLVADMHTVPTDCYGAPVGWVKHVGTGPINMGVFISSWNDGVQTAFIGPVMSYFEYTTGNFLRLTDEEWKSTYLQSALRPSWVNIYLADSSGNSKGNGPILITDIQEGNNNTNIPDDYVTAGNYPNPFNPTTIIWFKIPSNLTNSFTELSIYNVNGELISSLVNDVLPSGNYLVKWNGQNAKGKDVSSGIYLYHLKVADKLTTGKMVLMR